MEHGELKIKKFIVDNGKRVNEKPVRTCVLHGDIDAFHFHLHQYCGAQPKPGHGAAVELPKRMKKAA